MFYCRPSFVKRSAKGRSAISAAAYRAGEKLHDDESGKNWKYTKPEVIDKGIVLPENAPAEYKDRQTLWNAVQKAEQSADARLARELVVAIPHDLDKDAAKIMIHDFAAYLAKRGMCVDYAIHWKNGNHHAHMMLTTRQIEKNGEWAKYKEKKVYARDEQGNKIPLLDKDGKQKTKARKGKGVEKLWKRVSVIDNPWNKQAEYENWKRRLARIENRELIKAGSDVRVDSRSYKERGIDKVPQVHEGVAARAIESRGEKSFLREHNRQVRAINAEIEQTQELEKKLASLKKEKAQEQSKEITICGWEHLSADGKKQMWQSLPPVLRADVKRIKDEKLKREVSKQQSFFIKTAVFARNDKGGFEWLAIHKNRALEIGLMQRNKARTPIPTKIKANQIDGFVSKMRPELQDFNKKQMQSVSRGADSPTKAAGKAVESLMGAFDENKKPKQHMKDAVNNAVDVLMTPKKVVEDIARNPLMGLLTAPLRAVEAMANAASATANTAAAAAKTVKNGAGGNDGGDSSGGGGGNAAKEEDDPVLRAMYSDWKMLSDGKKYELLKKQWARELHL